MSEPTEDVKDVYKKPLYHAVRETLRNSTDEIGRNLEGKLLTLIDASFSDPQQRKAFKDVVKELVTKSYHQPIYDMFDSLSNQIAIIVGDKKPKEAMGISPCRIGECWITESELGYAYSRKDK